MKDDKGISLDMRQKSNENYFCVRASERTNERTYDDHNVTHYAVVSDWACKRTTERSHTKFFQTYGSAHEVTTKTIIAAATVAADVVAVVALSAFNGAYNGIWMR